MPSTVYKASKIFTGTGWLMNHFINVKDGLILSLTDTSQPGSDQIDLGNVIVAPAFIDLQVYGAGGKLFSVFPSAEALSALEKYEAAGGAAFCLPTVATNTPETVLKCIDGVKEYWNSGGETILGLHLEGPYINPKKRGAHIEHLIHPPTMAEVKALLEYGKDVIRMITLAPEVCNEDIINYIANRNIIVSAGHSDTDYHTAIKAMNNGIGAVTHLYNAMSGLHHREPGLVGAAMNHQKVWAGIIADGYHVNYEAIQIAHKIMPGRLYAITDAVTETGMGPYLHQLVNDKYEAAGILSGSALTMHKAFINLINKVGIELGEALKMCSSYPAEVLKESHRLGYLKPGYKADFVVLSENLEMLRLIRSGK